MCLSHLIYTVRPCLIHTCHAMPIPRSDHAVLLKATAQHGRLSKAVLWPWEERHGQGISKYESDTAALCKSNGKDTFSTLSGTAWQRYGMGATWERHGMWESALSVRRPSRYTAALCTVTFRTPCTTKLLWHTYVADNISNYTYQFLKEITFQLVFTLFKHLV